MAKYSVREAKWPNEGKFLIVKKDWLFGWVKIDLPLFNTFKEAANAKDRL